MDSEASPGLVLMIEALQFIVSQILFLSLKQETHHAYCRIVDIGSLEFEKHNELKSDNNDSHFNLPFICIEFRITSVISICNEVEFEFCVIHVC